MLLSRRMDPPPTITPLTTYNGAEASPALSPDARFVAFSWTGATEANRDIYVLLLGSATPLRLTQDAAPDTTPAWSADGKQVAFVRLYADLQYGIHAAPALGGPDRRLGVVQRIPSNFPLRISWRPDSQWIVVPQLTDEWRSSLYLVPAAGGAMRQLTVPPKGMYDVSGAISPDGRMIAYLRSTDGNTWQVHVADLDGSYRVADEARALGPRRYSGLKPI
jgi:Tol biopolymer transport system component